MKEKIAPYTTTATSPTGGKSNQNRPQQDEEGYPNTLRSKGRKALERKNENSFFDMAAKREPKIYNS